MEKSWENESKYKGGCQVHVPQNEKNKSQKQVDYGLPVKNQAPTNGDVNQPKPPKKGT